MQPVTVTADTDPPVQSSLHVLLYCTPAMNTLNSSKSPHDIYCKQSTQRGTLQHVTVHVHLCMQREYCELFTGEFTGGGAPLSGATGRKPCVQPPPLLTRQCTKFSSSSLCLVSTTTTAQRCLYMHVHIAGGGQCQLY